MMISPEYYYEEFLKGKSEQEIQAVIRRLKREIGRLKKAVEHPDPEYHIDPDEGVQLWCTREYLEEAKKALAEVGGEYKPSKAELKTQEFNDNIPYISEIEFSISNSPAEQRTYHADLSGEDVRITLTSSVTDSANEMNVSKCEKEYFLRDLRDLYIGEWRNKYIDPNIFDSRQWCLTIQYNNGKRSAKYCGNNTYSDRCEGLCDLFETAFEEWCSE